MIRKLTPMLVMTNAEIDSFLRYGLHSLTCRKRQSQGSPSNERRKGNFRVTHATGYIEVYPAKFCELPLKYVNEFLKFAKSHCNGNQQNSLLAMLEETKQQVRDSVRAERIGKIIQRIKTQRWEAC